MSIAKQYLEKGAELLGDSQDKREELELLKELKQTERRNWRLRCEYIDCVQIKDDSSDILFHIGRAIEQDKLPEELNFFKEVVKDVSVFTRFRINGKGYEVSISEYPLYKELLKDQKKLVVEGYPMRTKEEWDIVYEAVQSLMNY